MTAVTMSLVSALLSVVSCAVANRGGLSKYSSSHSREAEL